MEKDGESNQGWQIVLSNDLEALSDALGDALFSSAYPFEKRIVVVPNAGFKDFLYQRFVQHPRLKIAAGVQILALHQAVAEILDGTPAAKGKKRIPSFLELSLSIEEKLHALSEKIAYIASDPEKRCRRISSLSDELARLFSRYGLYGNTFLPAWLSRDGWQQTVWKSVFAEDSMWTYPLAFLKQMQPGCFPGKIALFGFSHLSFAHLHFFRAVPATVFHFSPCALFWEDLASDRERLSLNRFFLKRGGKEKVREELDAYMSQGHPLLNNWGKLGREMLKSLGGFLLDEKEVYVEQQKSTSLAKIKQSLLTLDAPEALQTDASLQLHSASSKLREVEILRDTLETWFQERLKRKESASLGDVLIASPDIAAYAPYIHMVFGKSPFAYAIEGLPLADLSETVQGFLQLMRLPEENYPLSAVLKLMRCAPFRERKGLSLDAWHQLKKWFKQARITAGLKSWEEGLDRLLFGLAMLPGDEAALDTWPIEAVPPSETDLLSRFLEIFSELKADLAHFAKEKSAAEWLEHFLRMADRHFAIDWERESFFQELKSLAFSCNYLVEKSWNFESIARVLRHLAELPSGKIASSRLDKISFVPLEQGRIRSAHLLWGLGMDEGAFPRRDAQSSLCEMTADYFPLKADEDRSLFLEMLVKTKETVIFSYQRVHQEDGKQQGPSLLIEELEQYLKKSGAAEGMMKIDHPLFTFDSSYFSPDAAVKKWSETDYLAAKAHYSIKRAPSAFFTPKAPKSLPAEIAIDIRQLKKLAQHPVKFYFNETLKIYLQEEEDEEEAEFLLSHLQKAILRKKVLSSSLYCARSVTQVLQKTGAQGALPRGLFQKAASEDFEEEIDDLLKAMQEFGLRAEEISSQRLSLTIPLSESRTVHITGELEDVTPQGLICHHMQSDLKSLIRIWPLYLLYRHLYPKNPFLLFTKKRKRIEIDVDPHEELVSFLEYFLLARQNPSPFMPDFAKVLLQGDEKDFAVALSKTAGEPYLNYLKRRHHLFDPKETLEAWGPVLKKTFRYFGESDAV